MANRYWVGGTGFWDGSSTTNWSAAPPIAFTASSSGTTLTTTGSPALANGMTVWNASGTSLGTITGGSGNSWTVSVGGTNFSQTMTAATTGASYPTSSDDVYFTANVTSFISYNCSVQNGPANSAVANNIFMSPTNTGNAFLTVGANLLIYGNLNITSNANVFFTGAGYLVLRGTNTGLTVNPGLYNSSYPPPPLSVDCGTGSYTLANNWLSSSTSGVFYLLSGTLDTNPVGNYTMQGSLFALGQSSTARTFNCNYSNLISGYSSDGGQYNWWIASNANLTLNSSNATLTMQGANTNMQLGSYSYGQIAITSNSLTTANLIGTPTIGNLIVSNRVASGIGNVCFTGNATINNITALSGTDATMRTIFTAQYGQYGGTGAKTITSNGTVSFTNVDFMDIVANGTTAPWSGNNLGNGGGTSNINFATTKTVYYVGSTNASWGSNNWSTTQAGTANANNFPLGQDTVIFDASHPIGNTGNNTITLNGSYLIGNLDTSSRTSSNTLTIAASTYTPVIVGNTTLNSNTTLTGSAGTTFVLSPRSPNLTLTSGGATFPANTAIAGSGNLVLADKFTVTPISNGIFQLFSGTLNLNNNVANVGVFYQPSTYTRGINFGTSGTLNITGNSVTVWNQVSYAGYSFSGTSNINLTYAGSVGTRTIQPSISSASEQYSPSFNVVAGTDVVLISTNSYFRDLNFTGFSGTWSLSTLNMYGNLTLSSTMNAPAAATVLTATGGNAYIGSNRTITTHGKSGNMLFYISYAANSNVTMSLQDDYVGTYPIATAIEVTSGTLNLNNHNVTAGGIVLAGSSLKTINLGSGNIILNGSGTVWGANASNGNTTVIPGTSTIFLSNASAKTFDGGSRTYYNVVQAGAGNLTIQGNNTLNTLSANTANTAIIFTANTTTTVSNFTVSGNAGNLVTLKSSTTGTKFNLSAASGVISVDYLSISDSNATGGASWYAGSHSSNVANNVGWIFSAAPAGGNGISITGGTFFDTSTGGITFTF